MVSLKKFKHIFFKDQKTMDLSDSYETDSVKNTDSSSNLNEKNCKSVSQKNIPFNMTEAILSFLHYNSNQQLAICSRYNFFQTKKNKLFKKCFNRVLALCLSFIEFFLFNKNFFFQC